nr:MetQ/NlpA family ABC transporter substrate-binding protein [Paraburkholderia caribensis]
MRRDRESRGHPHRALESAQSPRALEDVDSAAIQGNFAIASGHRLADALALEQMTSRDMN